jgi:hypothetical protein
VHSDVSRPRNIDELFFMLVWGQYGFDNKRVGTRYAELVLLHPVGSMGRVVHFGASGSRNVDELFFMLGRTVTNSTKGTPIQVRLFASILICGSRGHSGASVPQNRRYIVIQR